MVAAIVIPLLFLYFLVITIRERKMKYEEYLNLDFIKEEAFISGIVTQIDTKSKAFIGKHYVIITTLLLLNNNQVYYKAVKTSPSSKGQQTITEGMQIICYGYWEKDVFIFNEFKIKT
jgi:hypothetical protein